MNLEGKTALVTGGSRGIGEKIVLTLADYGANVIINYSNNDEKAKKVVDEVEKIGKKALAIKADISNMEEAKKLIEESYKEFDKIDILVNNAGITKDNLIMRMSEDDWDKVMNVNLKGAFNVTKSIIRKMIKQKSGSIINISSIVGLHGNAGQCNYSASKAGLLGLTKSLAKEVGKKNIRVNSIAPGFIETEMTDKLSNKVKDNYLKDIPLNKLGETSDVANTVLFLSSDLSKYMTGQVLVVDGGLSV